MKSELIIYAKGLGAEEHIVEWIDKRITKELAKNISECEHIIDYLISGEAPKRLERATYKQIKANTDKWNRSLIKKGNNISEEEDVDYKTILDFEDGFKFVKLISQNAYQREGNLMRHCVASYYGRDVDIYSLRDKNNQPHCTIEKDNQIKGKGNGDISPRYIKYVVDFLEHLDIKVRDVEMEHLGYRVAPFVEYIKDKTKLFRDRYVKSGEKLEYIDSVIVFNDLLEAVTYSGHKYCLFDGSIRRGTYSKVASLGNLRQISGTAYFRNTKVTNLGKLERICGYANFSDSNVTNLGNLKEIGGDANFEWSEITSLGGLERIGGNAYFKGSNVTNLGKLERIGGSANFECSKVTDLGNLKKVGGSAYFSDSNVTDLGKLERIGGNACFINTKITNLCNLNDIGGYAYFKDSKVTNLGKLERIGGNACFRNTKITNLCNLKKIGGYANFECSKITSLGKLERIGGSAYFKDSKVTNLGSLERIGGHAFFKDSKVADLGNLKEIGGSAYFRNTKVTNLGKLERICGSAYFKDSKVTGLGKLETGEMVFISTYSL